MIIPVRCFSCNKVIADRWESYSKAITEGENAGSVLDRLGFKRYCCRRMFLTHVDILQSSNAHISMKDKEPLVSTTT